MAADLHLLPIAELNALPPPKLAHALRPLLEADGPLADALAQHRPYQSYQQLLDRAATLLASFTDAERKAVVNAHPRIGEAAHIVRETSISSFREQGYHQEASLDREALAHVYTRLAELNRAYEARFGFRFVVFVNGRPKSALIEVLQRRLENSREQELETAAKEVVAIARDRLRRLAE